MDIDRQAIEKRDFPIGRRGYDPAAVDAHLRALATEFEELQRALSGAGAESSLATTAGSQVQSILEAAETAAADIERLAREDARQARKDANRDAEQTREDAVERAQAHVAAVGQATAILLQRVASMDGEVGALVERLNSGAGGLASDLEQVEKNMAALYDAASGGAASAATETPARVPSPAAQAPATSPPGRVSPPIPTPTPSAARSTATAPAQADAATQPAENGDLDGARLIALNMALNGESRADADRYLADHFELADRLKLIDEVYSAVEG